MKRILVFGALMVLITNISSLAFSATKNYVNENLRYSFDYPDNWQLQTYKNGVTLFSSGVTAEASAISDLTRGIKIEFIPVVPVDRDQYLVSGADMYSCGQETTAVGVAKIFCVEEGDYLTLYSWLGMNGFDLMVWGYIPRWEQDKNQLLEQFKKIISSIKKMVRIPHQ